VIFLLGMLLSCGSEAMGQTQGPAGPRARASAEVLLGELDNRDRALDRRETSLMAREEELRNLEAELQSRLEELEGVRTELSTLLEQADAERETKVQGLVKMVEVMRGNQAAAVLVELEPELAIEVLDRMKSTKAGKALAAMPPVKAAVLAERMTRRPLEQ
jgi:flagellar motility protein MotE (MotC chaperone)